MRILRNPLLVLFSLAFVLFSCDETFNVTLEMVRRGYSEKEVEMIWGGNTIRLLREVEAVAAEMQVAEIATY